MSSKLILLVVDDNNLRQSIALILKRAGYSVCETECAKKAISMLEATDFQLVISDMNMPATRNLLIPSIRGSYSDLPLIILTDQSTYEVEKEANKPCPHYLVKPIAPESLLDFVHTVVAVEKSPDESVLR